jgi:hypothetical protein
LSVGGGPIRSPRRVAQPQRPLARLACDRDPADLVASRARSTARSPPGDVVCPTPTKDRPNQTTAMVAAHVLFDLASLIADRLRP